MEITLRVIVWPKDDDFWDVRIVDDDGYALYDDYFFCPIKELKEGQTMEQKVYAHFRKLLRQGLAGV